MFNVPHQRPVREFLFSLFNDQVIFVFLSNAFHSEILPPTAFLPNTPACRVTSTMTKELRFIVVFCLITAMEGSMALSEGEERAISDLFQEWPFLGGLYPPWTSNSSEACNAPFKGLNCTTGPDQHILSLYDTNFCNCCCFQFPGLVSDSANY